MKKYKFRIFQILLTIMLIIFYIWYSWFSMSRVYNAAFSYHLSINSQNNLSQVDLLKTI
jgi:hypothetical protein